MARIHLAFTRLTVCVLSASIGLAVANVAVGQTTTYNTDTDTSGSWHVVGSWSSGIPNAAGAAAVLNQPISTGVSSGGQYTIGLGGLDTTIGSLTSNNASSEAQGFRTQINNGRLIFETISGPATFNENLGIAETTAGFIEMRLRINVPVELKSDLIVNSNHALNKNTNTEIFGRIDAAAERTLTKEGFGNLQLDYAGTPTATQGFMGNVIINNGAIRLIVLNNGSEGTVNTVFSKAAGVTVNAGGQFQFGNILNSVSLGPGAELKLNGTGKVAPAATSQNDGALRFEGSAGFGVNCSFNNPVNLQTNSHINVAADDATGTLTAEVRGPGQLQKTGSGLLVLTSANVYTGGTNVSNGTISVNNTTGSGVGTGNVAINGTNNPARLGGTGIIGSSGDPSNVMLTTGGLYPGTLTATTAFADPDTLISGPGILTTFGDVTFDSASSLNIDIAGATLGTQYDQLATDGVITLGGSMLNFSLGTFVPTGTETFTLIDNTGASAVVGEFGNYTQGAAVDLAGQTFFIDYSGGTGNDVVLSSSPPSLEDADFDGDGDVDGADFLTWQRGVGTAGGQPEGNADGVGGIDGADLDVWKNQFGTATVAAGAIPEPTSAVLLLLAAGVAALTYRRVVRA